MPGLNVLYAPQFAAMLRQLTNHHLLGAAATMHKINEIIKNGITDNQGNHTEPLIAVVNHHYDVFLIDVPHPGNDILYIFDRGGAVPMSRGDPALGSPALTLVSLKPNMLMDVATKDTAAQESAIAKHLIITNVHVVV